MNFQDLTEYDLSFELVLTNDEGEACGSIQVPATTRSDLICHLVRETEQGITIRPVKA